MQLIVGIDADEVFPFCFLKASAARHHQAFVLLVDHPDAGVALFVVITELCALFG